MHNRKKVNGNTAAVYESGGAGSNRPEGAYDMAQRNRKGAAWAARRLLASALALMMTLSLLTSGFLLPSAHAEVDENGKEVFCGLTAHEHSEACYSDEGELICGLTEHAHTLECYSDRSAVESEADWRASVSNAMITGRWDEDLIAVAKTQVGYCESRRNYIVRDGVMRGYTRYGDWIDNSESVVYGGWSASFVAFCMYYAGIRGVPFSANCATWVKKLADAGMYYDYGEIEPKAGDLVFFYSGREADALARKAFHMGIIVETNENGFLTIEGINPVSYREYSFEKNGMILGFGRLPENPEYRHFEADGGKMTLSGVLPEDTELRIRPLSDEELAHYKLPEGKVIFAFEAKLLSDGKEVRQRGAASIRIETPDAPQEGLNVIHIREYDNGTICEKYPVEKLKVSDGCVSYIDFSVARYIGIVCPTEDAAGKP